MAKTQTERKSVALTERRIRDVKPSPKARIIWDSRLVGFGVKVSPGGTKSYLIDYRDSSGRQRRATLARVGEVTLAEARERAGAELAAVRAGEADPLRRRREAREAPTVAEAIEQFFAEEVPARMAAGRMGERTRYDYSRQCARTVIPALGRLKVRDVTRADIEAAVAGLGRVQRNRTLALCSRLFVLFERWELRPEHTNPVRHVERAREEARDRTLTKNELAALAVAFDDIAKRRPGAVAALRVAAITGLRIGEVAAIRWEHIDFVTGRLTMPQTKTGRRVHDLPVAAVDILRAVPRASDWVFAGRGDGPLCYGALHDTYRRAASAAGVVGTRIHDLRRTVMTRAAAAGVGTHVLRDLLGHRTSVMADRYIRAVGSPVREARHAVGAAMAAAMAGKPATDGEP